MDADPLDAVIPDRGAVPQDAADLFAYTLTIGYDPRSFTLVGTDVNARGVSDATTKAGWVTVSNTKIGTSPGSEGQTRLVTLTFKATSQSSTSGVALTNLDTANSKGTTVSVF
jgi:hypothetical protein